MFPISIAAVLSLLVVTYLMAWARAQTVVPPLQLEDVFAFSVSRSEDGALLLHWRIARCRA